MRRLAAPHRILRRPFRAASSRRVSAHTAPAPPLTTARFLAPSRRATAVLSQLLASLCRPGDTLCLHGSVGVGKSYFCREFVRALVDDPALSVPSPTFLLQQTYDAAGSGLLVHHFDLYRVNEPAALGRLDLAAQFASGVSLVEWAERLGPHTPPQRLELRLTESALAGQAGPEPGEEEEEGEEGTREVSLLAYGERWRGAAEAVRSFLDNPPADSPPLGGLRALDSG